MNLFEKICAVPAAILGMAFLGFGAMGIFMDVKLWLTLPPVLGGLLLIPGWGILAAIWRGWSAGPKGAVTMEGPTVTCPRCATTHEASPQGRFKCTTCQTRFEIYS